MGVGNPRKQDQGRRAQVERELRRENRLRRATGTCVDQLEARVLMAGTPPSVVGSQFVDSVSSGGQRLVYVFAGGDVGQTLTAADVLVQNLDTGQRVDAAKVGLQYTAATGTAVVTFPGLSGGILPDGNYRAIVRASGVSANELPLDGDRDGTD